MPLVEGITSCKNWWIFQKKSSYLLDTHWVSQETIKKQGVCYIVALPFTLKKS
jgi:hypothetical protein